MERCTQVQEYFGECNDSSTFSNANKCVDDYHLCLKQGPQESVLVAVAVGLR